MTEERVMDSVSGSIWGPPGPQRKERTMITDRATDRKEKYLKKIMGELEAYVETPGEEWGENEEDAIIDMLDAVEHSMKAQLSSNDREYKG